MTVLAFTIKAHTGIRLAELGFLAGVIGGILLILSGNPRRREAMTTFGGLALVIGFVLLIVATRWGHFH